MLATRGPRSERNSRAIQEMSCSVDKPPRLESAAALFGVAIAVRVGPTIGVETVITEVAAKLMKVWHVGHTAQKRQLDTVIAIIR